MGEEHPWFLRLLLRGPGTTAGIGLCRTLQPPSCVSVGGALLFLPSQKPLTQSGQKMLLLISRLR